MAIRTILLAVALACASASALPVLHAQGVTVSDVAGTCDPMQSVHTYYVQGGGPGNPDGWSGGYEEQSTADDCSQASATVPDLACLESPSLSCVSLGDSDFESGIGSAEFAAGTFSCLAGFSHGVSHHDYAPGSTYWANNLGGLPVAWTVGTDGPAPGFDCASNGIISSDPTTDPNDCGRGQIGYYANGAIQAATIGANVAGNTCDPIDGQVLGIVLGGPFTTNPWGSVVHLGILDANGDPVVPPQPSVTLDPDNPPTVDFVSVPIAGQFTDAGPLP